MLVLARPQPFYKFILRYSSTLSQGFDKFFFFQRGRDALIAGINALQIKPGSNILVPAYICDSITKELKSFGYKVFYVDVDMDLKLDVEKITEIIESKDIKLVLAVHYFGFYTNIQEIVSICHKFKVPVIEDCCHSFLTNKNQVNVGISGDISIFSLRKTLPCQDGGGLLINSKKIKLVKDNSEVDSSFFATLIYLIGRFFESIVAMIGWPNLYSSFINDMKVKLRGMVQSNKVDMKNFPTATLKPSYYLNNYLNDSEYLLKVSTIRRNNFKALLEISLKLNLSPLITTLDSGCVPQYFPLYDDRQIIVDSLRKQGIGAIRWPWTELPEEVKISSSSFPLSMELDRKLALIPIHQGIKKSHLKKIKTALINCNL